MARYYSVQLSSFGGTNLLCTFTNFQFHSVHLSLYPPLFLTHLILFYHFATNLLRLTVPFFHKPLYSSRIGRSNNARHGHQNKQRISLQNSVYHTLESSCPRQRVTQRRHSSLSLSLSLLFNNVYLKNRTLGI